MAFFGSEPTDNPSIESSLLDGSWRKCRQASHSYQSEQNRPYAQSEKPTYSEYFLFIRRFCRQWPRPRLFACEPILDYHPRPAFGHHRSHQRPTKAGTYSFAEKVTGCGGYFAEASYKVVIQATPNHVVDLSWKASTSGDTVGYNMYRGPNGTTWTKINAGLIGSTVYSDATASDGSTYYYAATAVDVYGHESSKTPAVKAVIP